MAMNEDEARKVVAGLLTEQLDLRLTYIDVGQRLEAIGRIVEGFEQLYPGITDSAVIDAGAATLDMPKAQSDSRPRGQEAALRVLSAPEFQGRYWTVGQMTEELARRGWAPESEQPATAVRTALDRAVIADPVHMRKGRGQHGNVVFFYKHVGMAEPNFHDPDNYESGSVLSAADMPRPPYLTADPMREMFGGEPHPEGAPG